MVAVRAPAGSSCTNTRHAVVVVVVGDAACYLVPSRVKSAGYVAGFGRGASGMGDSGSVGLMGAVAGAGISGVLLLLCCCCCCCAVVVLLCAVVVLL
jgi:hypothetical protein